MHRNFKYRLWTRPNQERELEILRNTHRHLWNDCLGRHIATYETSGLSLNSKDHSRWFRKERDTNQFFAKLNFSSAQITMQRLDQAFVRFFQRVKTGIEAPGFPRFKGFSRFRSFTFTYADGCKLRGDKLYVQNVGLIRIKMHRPLVGTPKQATIMLQGGKWYVVISCQIEDQPVAPNGQPPVGIDVGLRSFATLSTGETIDNPRILTKKLARLRVLNRSVSRKTKGGKTWTKAVKTLNNLYAHVRNARNDFLHKTANDLVRRFGLVAVERLNIAPMLKNRRLARPVLDAGWSGFRSHLRYKAECAGAQVVDVSARGTSQECSGCGETVAKHLKILRHRCPHCGLNLDRDHNAALVILKRALARAGPGEHNVDP